MSDFLRSYLTDAIFGGAALAVVAGLLGLGSYIRPTRRQAGKYVNYESGVDPVGSGWMQAEIRYYIFAVLFVMFDVEAVFIFPWATRLEAYGTFGAVDWGGGGGGRARGRRGAGRGGGRRGIGS